MAEREPPPWLAGPLAEIREALAGIDDAALELMSPAERRLVESARSAVRTYDASGPLRGVRDVQFIVDEASRFDATGELDAPPGRAGRDG
jgi:hypothetical protein